MTKEASTNDEPPKRPILKRLAHTIGEVALSFLFAAGVCLVSIKLMCLDNHSCNDFGGIAFFVAGLIVAMFTWGMFLSLCKRFRDRPDARRKFDIVAVVVTVGLWIGFYVLT